MSSHPESGPETAAVTIGLPVYNGEATLERAIEALLSQTCKHLVLVISDNASTDATQAICEAMAARDSRVKYIRQAENIGAFNNFRFVLDRAQTPYFMWTAHDDWLETDTVERCLRMLQIDPGLSAAIPETLFHGRDNSKRKARGCASITGPAAFRLARYLARPADNSRFYGLFHTAVIKQSFPDDLGGAPASDWVISALTLSHGAHVCVKGACLHRSAAEPGRYARMLKPGLASKLDRYIPTASMSCNLLRHLPWPLAVASLPSLLLLACHQSIWLRWVSISSRRQ